MLAKGVVAASQMGWGIGRAMVGAPSFRQPTKPFALLRVVNLVSGWLGIRALLRAGCVKSSRFVFLLH